MLDQPRTLVLTPAFNEEATIAQVVEGVRAQGLPSVVIDDGSADRTADAARGAGAVVIKLPMNMGVGAALRTGFRYAVSKGFDRVVQIDGDLQHDPASIPLLLEAANLGSQLVVGSRFGSGYDAGRRRPAMKLLSAILSRRTGVQIDDPTSGYKVVSEPLLSEFARAYPAEYLGDTVEALIRAATLGATIAQVEVPMRYRSEGMATSTSRAAVHFGRVLIAIGTGKAGRSAR